MVASKSSKRPRKASVGDGLGSAAEQLVNQIIKPLGLVVLTRDRIQQTLDEAAERGRLTRSDANDLVAELVGRGRQQTEELLGDIERLAGRGRQQLDSATRLAMRTFGAGGSPPIADYDELTAAQIGQRLGDLSQSELRRLRDYEARHANRKSVLSAIDRSLS